MLFLKDSVLKNKTVIPIPKTFSIKNSCFKAILKVLDALLTSF